MNTTEEEVQALDPETVAADEVEAESGAGEEQGEEVIVSIGEPTEPQQEEEARAPEWVRELRRKHRETTKELAETRKKLETLTAEPKPAAMGKKPTLEDCDYDSDKYESELTAWFERKRAADEQEAKAKQAEDAAKAGWQAKLERYEKAKSELKDKVPDFEEAEAEAFDILDVTQKGMIVQGSKNPALLMCAIGNNKEEGQKLAAIKDPVEFVWAAATMEATQLKVTKKTALPPPERTLNGTGRVSGTVDSHLAKLEAEADRTGDRSKIVAYKLSLRSKATK